ncbi:MAG: glucosylglycerol hydrolase [Cyanobacteria bacterium J06633_2]
MNRVPVEIATLAPNASKIRLNEEATQELMQWAADITSSDDTFFARGRKLASRLGAHYREDGLTEIGFWTPELAGEVIQSERTIYLEFFTPIEPVDFRAPEQSITFRCDRLPVPQQGEYVWAVVDGIQPGTRDQLGTLYWLQYLDGLANLHTVRDVVALSLPYGVFAPAEVYDMKRLERDRKDLAHFKATGYEVPTVLPPATQPDAETDDQTSLDPQTALLIDSKHKLPTVPAPVNLLQLHVATASPGGTLESLTELFQTISDKLAAGQPLTPAEINYTGYDGIQLLPIEPTIEYRHEGDNTDTEFFAIPNQIQLDMEAAVVRQKLAIGEQSSPDDTQTFEITLRKPNTQNWGYDIPILGSSATNPAVLGSLRPDELVDFIATMHNFSEGPIQVIYDLVYGHADNQSQQLISRQFLKGPNMYGQDLNHQLPMVRAILLEMHRRKLNAGADGIRVDGGQDFRFFNPLTGLVQQDDAYLLEMSNVVQEIGGYQRTLFTIFEDGRPWPQEGWEESSTYRDLIELQPESYQWGPLIFAHNTPALRGFWDEKWRRVTEVMTIGDRWITGCANHDTVRRGTQVSYDNKPINWNLGETLPEVLQHAYDNPAVKLWVYGFSPGLPMDFINALMHSAWGFFRNTDDRYGVKVMSEEIGFLDWQMTHDIYAQVGAFKRIKALGFNDLDVLRQFCKALAVAMAHSEYDLEAVSQICHRCLGDDASQCDVPSIGELEFAARPEFMKNLNVPQLKVFARAYLEDMHDLSNVCHQMDQVDPVRAAFNEQLRRYRLAHPWVRENLHGLDRFNRVSDESYTVFYGLRTQPTPEIDDESTAIPEHPTPESLVMVTHMGGDPVDVALADWLQLNLSEWKVAIATPGLTLPEDLSDLRVFTLKDSEGVLLEKKCDG